MNATGAVCGESIQTGKPAAPPVPSMPGGRAPTFGAGRRAPIPYGSRGVLSEKGAPLRPPGHIKPHDSTKGIGSRELPRTSVPEAFPFAQGTYPRGGAMPLSRPELARTTRPLHLIGDPALLWASRYPVRPTVGDWLPMNGKPRMVALNIEGGRPLPWKPTYPRAAELLPMDDLAKKRLRAFNLEVRRLRLKAKRVVVLLAGPSPLEYAQALRGKPGTPGQFTGAGRQELARPNFLRGRRNEQDKAPTPILDKMSREAAAVGAR